MPDLHGHRIQKFAKEAGDVQRSLAAGGAPVVGTRVKLKNLDTGAVVRGITGAGGAFSFAGVASGRLKVIVLGVTVP